MSELNERAGAKLVLKLAAASGYEARHEYGDITPGQWGDILRVCEGTLSSATPAQANEVKPPQAAPSDEGLQIAVTALRNAQQFLGKNRADCFSYDQITWDHYQKGIDAILAVTQAAPSEPVAPNTLQRILDLAERGASHGLLADEHCGEIAKLARAALAASPAPSDRLREFADEVKGLCRDFSSRTGSVYVSDVEGSIDGLYALYAAATPAPAQQAESDVSQANARDGRPQYLTMVFNMNQPQAAGARELLREAGWVRACWSDAMTERDEARAAIASATTSTEGK